MVLVASAHVDAQSSTNTFASSQLGGLRGHVAKQSSEAGEEEGEGAATAGEDEGEGAAGVFGACSVFAYEYS